MEKNIDYLRYVELVNNHLLDFLPEIDHKSNTLRESMEYSLLAGGKRIRPALLLGACEFAKGDINGGLPYACAIEYIHTYSLIHDDLPGMDDDDLRRGQATNHKVYGEAIAILAGDCLLSSAFEAMHKDVLLYFDNEKLMKQKLRAAYEIAKGAGGRGMIAGQVADIEAENKKCSKEMLDYIHINKTGALIVAAVRAGASLGDPSPGMMKDLTDFAENLGLAFQIADDLLDLSGTEAVTGKRTKKDMDKNKSTYPCCYGEDEAKERLQALTDKALAALEPYYDEAEFFNRLAVDLAGRVK